MRRALVPLALALAACSSQPDDPAAITPDEARRLDDAAEMLDANSVSAQSLEDDDNETDGNQADD